MNDKVETPGKYDKRGLHPYVAYLKDHYPDYDKWVAEQHVPVITGHYISDCTTEPLYPWERMGGNGVFINLSDQTVDDAYLVEIPPGGSLHPERHLYEELTYVVAGHGATAVWQAGQEPVQFEWHAGSFFAIPLNAYHQHFNGSGDEPARLLAATSAPLTINLLHNTDVVFNCDYTFADRFGGGSEFFNGEKTFRDGVHSGLWETNFIADVSKVELRARGDRGKGESIFLALAGSAMKSHISRFPIGTYKKAHRHGPGAHIYIVGGEGYTLMWEEGKPRQRYEWRVGSLISPPNNWYHQHFNTGDQPATYLALQRPVVIYNKGGSHQIEYEDEDPAIREEYVAELKQRGVELRMPPVDHRS